MPSASSPSDGRDPLRSACERNISLELHCLSQASTQRALEADVMVARSRLLHDREQEIEVDSIQCIGKRLRIGPGAQVDAYFFLDEQLLTFRSVVTKVRHVVELNEEKKIVGLCLSRPRRVSQGQRREDHRVSVAGLAPIDVSIHEASPDNPNTSGLAAWRFTGQMVNLSRGGMAVRVEGPDRFRFRVSRFYYLSFAVPSEDEDMLFLVESRHVREMDRQEARIIGFQFLPWPSPLDLREHSRRIGKFCIETERQQLSRGRSKPRPLADSHKH